MSERARALAAAVVAHGPTVGPVRLVCVDGPAGSGKTTLADELVAALEPTLGPVPVVHGDDVYQGWAVVAEAPDRLTAFDLLGERVVGLLLEPWAAGRAGTHPVWDWCAGRWGASRAVPPAPVVILEGVGLGGARLRARAALTVWVEADPGERLARVLARDGAALHEEMTRWQDDEARWHEQDGTREGSDVRLRT